MHTPLALAIASALAITAHAATLPAGAGNDQPILAKRGADNPPGDQRRGRGQDDPAGHRIRQDAVPVVLAKRGADNPPGDQRRGRGQDDPASHRVWMG